jgi:hypothetical protein
LEDKKELDMLINDRQVEIELKSVNYKTVELEKELPFGTKVRSSVRDSYKIEEIMENHVIIEYKREKFFEPKVLFEAEMIFRVKYIINKGNNTEFRVSVVEDEVRNRADELLMPVATRASLMVSMLTNISAGTPIVDPPYPNFKKEETKMNYE